ncbi:hypothetical protein [Bradyrhizobium sp. Bra64]|uniref:hypothetical protein n=1 Tax=Bradyrhizobium sp. Bra64 TaxID=2926009 RepID=UPI002117DA8A|nr:hypothetical protein [Bradyrhizobium sp. Bra64]
MAKRVYSFKKGNKNIFGLTYDKTGANLPVEAGLMWKPFKAFEVGEGTPPRLGLEDDRLAELEKNGFCVMGGLKMVPVYPGQPKPPTKVRKK